MHNSQCTIIKMFSAERQLCVVRCAFCVVHFALNNHVKTKKQILCSVEGQAYGYI